MSKFTDTVKADTPRLVVMFHRDGDKEMFQWGLVGAIPILTLVGGIVRVQAELTFKAAEECDQLALVITWDDVQKKIDWYVHADIPIDSLVGMLETIKAAILGSHMARQAAAQQIGLVDGSGQPLRRKGIG